MVIWLTGLSGSGKTTLAKTLEGFIHLDGDVLRKGVSKDLGFSPEDREENIKRAITVASYLDGEGKDVVCSFITPYNRLQNLVKKRIPESCLVFVKCPLSLCIQRDPKGLYEQVRKGNIKNFTGIDAPYEDPRDPDYIIDTCELTLKESIVKLNIIPGLEDGRLLYD